MSKILFPILKFVLAFCLTVDPSLAASLSPLSSAGVRGHTSLEFSLAALGPATVASRWSQSLLATFSRVPRVRLFRSVRPTAVPDPVPVIRDWQQEFRERYVEEMRSLGVDEVRIESIIQGFPKASFDAGFAPGFWSKNLRTTAVREDLRRLIRAKERQNDRQFVFVSVGLGSRPREAVDLVLMLDEIIHEESSAARDWTIRFFGVDAEPDFVASARRYFDPLSEGSLAHLQELDEEKVFPASLHVGDLLMSAARGNGVDRFGLEDLLAKDFLEAENRHRSKRGMPAVSSPIAADYVVHANVTYVNSRAQDARSELHKNLSTLTDAEWMDFLNAFMQYRAVASALARPGIHYVVDAMNPPDEDRPQTDNFFAPPGAIPIAAHEVVRESALHDLTWGPQGLVRVAVGSPQDRGVGILRISDVNAIRTMTLSQFQKSIQNSDAGATIQIGGGLPSDQERRLYDEIMGLLEHKISDLSKRRDLAGALTLALGKIADAMIAAGLPIDLQAEILELVSKIKPEAEPTFESAPRDIPSAEALPEPDRSKLYKNEAGHYLVVGHYEDPDRFQVWVYAKRKDEAEIKVNGEADVRAALVGFTEVPLQRGTIFEITREMNHSQRLQFREPLNVIYWSTRIATYSINGKRYVDEVKDAYQGLRYMAEVLSGGWGKILPPGTPFPSSTIGGGLPSQKENVVYELILQDLAGAIDDAEQRRDLAARVMSAPLSAAHILRSANIPAPVRNHIVLMLRILAQGDSERSSWREKVAWAKREVMDAFRYYFPNSIYSRAADLAEAHGVRLIWLSGSTRQLKALDEVLSRIKPEHKRELPTIVVWPGLVMPFGGFASLSFPTLGRSRYIALPTLLSPKSFKLLLSHVLALRFTARLPNEDDQDAHLLDSLADLIDDTRLLLFPSYDALELESFLAASLAGEELGNSRLQQEYQPYVDYWLNKKVPQPLPAYFSDYPYEQNELFRWVGAAAYTWCLVCLVGILPSSLGFLPFSALAALGALELWTRVGLQGSFNKISQAREEPHWTSRLRLLFSHSVLRFLVFILVLYQGVELYRHPDPARLLDPLDTTIGQIQELLKDIQSDEKEVVAPPKFNVTKLANPGRSSYPTTGQLTSNNPKRWTDIYRIFFKPGIDEEYRDLDDPINGASDPFEYEKGLATSKRSLMSASELRNFQGVTWDMAQVESPKLSIGFRVTLKFPGGKTVGWQAIHAFESGKTFDMQTPGPIQTALNSLASQSPTSEVLVTLTAYTGQTPGNPRLPDIAHKLQYDNSTYYSGRYEISAVTLRTETSKSIPGRLPSPPVPPPTFLPPQTAPQSMKAVKTAA